MAVTTILFDLDGTLLPMDQSVFVKKYFSMLAAHLAPHGYDSGKLIDTIWAGTAAMVKNDGSCTNEEAFWKVFCSVFGEESLRDMPLFDYFYENIFDNVKSSCGYDERADKAVKEIKSLGYRTALATNPIFPKEATECRMRWAGLDEADFELFTTYNNSRFCKPNPSYYKDVCESLGVDPAECLMVGNDVEEDMIAEKLGMKVFLLTDNLINRSCPDISVYPHGSFPELLEFVRSL